MAEGDVIRSKDLGLPVVVDRQGAVGAQPYEVIEKLLVDAGARQRDPTVEPPSSVPD